MLKHLLSLMQRAMRWSSPTNQLLKLSLSSPIIPPGQHAENENSLYLLPHSIPEYERLYFQHYLLYKVLKNRHFFVTLHNPQYILDVGSGTGHWVYDVAKQFPKAIVFGTDIVLPARPSNEAINVSFKRHNILQEDLPFRAHSFDFVHMRFMTSALPTNSLNHVMLTLWQMVKPGGWIEWIEPGELTNAGPGTTALWNAWRILGEKRGMNVQPGNNIRSAFESVPLIHIKEHHIEIPVGGNNQRLGTLSGKDGVALAKALGPNILEEKIMTEPEFNQALYNAGKEINDPYSQCIWSIYAITGQRPL